VAYSTPSFLRKRNMRNALNRPLAMSRGLGAALVSRHRPRIHPSHKISPWKHILSSQGHRGYTRRVHSCAPHGEKQRKDKPSPKRSNEHNQTLRTTSKGVPSLLHRLQGYTRWVRLRAPPEKSNPKNKHQQQAG
jgi:hypothetical protein